MAVPTRMMILSPTIDKVVDTSLHKGVQQSERFALSKDAEIFLMHDASNAHQGMTFHVFTGMMGLVLGIVTVIYFPSIIPMLYLEAILYSCKKSDANTMIQEHFDNHFLFEIRIRCLHLTLHLEDRCFSWMRECYGSKLI